MVFLLRAFLLKVFLPEAFANKKATRKGGSDSESWLERWIVERSRALLPVMLFLMTNEKLWTAGALACDWGRDLWARSQPLEASSCFFVAPALLPVMIFLTTA